MASQKTSGLNTVVGNGSILEGSFKVQDGIRVDGTLRGQLISSGTLVVGPSGNLEADPIQVKDAAVSGRVVGKLEATGSVRLEASAVLIGDVSATVLIVEEGAVIRGFCESGEGPALAGNGERNGSRSADVAASASGEESRELNVEKAVG